MVEPLDARPPRLSVGLAVFNGADYLDEAIKSLLTQTFEDFELIICDNASTDRTQEICEHYAAVDDRVRYYRNPKNIGGANNENLTFALSRGEYFRWAAHDDICAPELFERCIETLDRTPDAVLCYTRSVIIGGAGDIKCEVFHEKGMAATPARRLRELAFRDHGCEATYGVVRSKILAAAGLQKNYTDSDRILLCALALRGRFIQLDEPLFLKRYHEKNQYLDWRERMFWFEPEGTRHLFLPHWLELGDLTTAVLRAPLGLRQRAACLGWVSVWLARYAKKLLADVKYTVWSSADRLLRRRPDARQFHWE
jgi:glycosyltransferase involved in cell wall biosynthesis